MKEQILKYILSRLSEASSWRGIIMLFAGTWATRHPEQVEAVIPIAIAIAGSVGVFLPDKKTIKTKNDQDTPVNLTVENKEIEAEETTEGWGDK